MHVSRTPEPEKKALRNKSHQSHLAETCCCCSSFPLCFDIFKFWTLLAATPISEVRHPAPELTLGLLNGALASANLVKLVSGARIQCMRTQRSRTAIHKFWSGGATYWSSCSPDLLSLKECCKQSRPESLPCNVERT